MGVCVYKRNFKNTDKDNFLCKAQTFQYFHIFLTVAGGLAKPFTFISFILGSRQRKASESKDIYAIY